MRLLNLDCCTDHSLGLHLGNFRISNCQTASSVSHHRVEFMQAVDHGLDFMNTLILRLRKLLNIRFLGRNELMKRRIQKTDGYRISFECFIKLPEVSLLIRKNLFECSFSFFYSIGTDHFTECCNTIFLKEHMLRTAKSDSLCPKLSCSSGIMGSISVGTNL